MRVVGAEEHVVRAQQLDQLADLPSPPEELVRLNGQVRRAVAEGSKRRKSLLPVDHELIQAYRLQQILQPDLYAELYGDLYNAVRINYYPPRGDAKEGWDNIDIFGWLGYPMQIKIDFLCSYSILAAPLVLDLVLFLDLAQRAGLKGIQEWLSFYFKGPMTAPGLYPEHDIFIQLMKLKNTLRWMQGEELITHLGLEYYD